MAIRKVRSSREIFENEAEHESIYENKLAGASWTKSERDLAFFFTSSSFKINQLTAIPRERPSRVLSKHETEHESIKENKFPGASWKKNEWN